MPHTMQYLLKCDLQALYVSVVHKMKMLINTEKCCGDMESHTHRKASAVLLLSLKHQAVSHPELLKTLVKKQELLNVPH